jgi:glycosyltransferase involved in cell wall biosynthesis
MAAFDVLILPSRSEGMPLTVLEAMYAGVPVVAFDVGDVSAVVRNGSTGWLVPVDQLDLFRKKLLEALRNPEQRLSRGHASAQLMAREYSEANWLKKHLAVYSDGLVSRE